MGLNIWQILLVVAVLLLLFGRGRVPALMGDIAQGIKSFKQGIREDDSPHPESLTSSDKQTTEVTTTKSDKQHV